MPSKIWIAGSHRLIYDLVISVANTTVHGAGAEKPTLCLRVVPGGDGLRDVHTRIGMVKSGQNAKHAMEIGSQRSRLHKNGGKTTLITNLQKINQNHY